MENPQHHTLAPLDRPEAERPWATEPREMPHNGYQDRQHRQPHPAETVHNGLPPGPRAYMSTTGSPNGLEEERMTEMTRAGVQVELKKRKRVRHFGSTSNDADER